jgi:hypothetical protein
MAWWPFGRRQPAPPVDIPQALRAIPRRPETVEVKEDSRGMLHLRVTQAPGGFAKKVAEWLHQSYTRTYELDEFGTFYYRQVDGATSLKKIAKRLYQEFGPQTGRSRDEIEMAVVIFTKSLMLKNALELLVERSSSGETRE